VPASKGTFSKARTGRSTPAVFDRARTETTVLDAARTDVEDHVGGAHVVHIDDARGRVRLEFFCHHASTGRRSRAWRLSLVHDLARGRDEIGLEQGFADLAALRRQEGVGHRAADDQRVHFIQQIASRSSLVDTFAPRETAARGRCGCSAPW